MDIRKFTKEVFYSWNYCFFHKKIYKVYPLIMVRFRDLNSNEVRAHLDACLHLPHSELSRTLHVNSELYEESYNLWTNCLVGQLLTFELPDDIEHVRWAFKKLWEIRYNIQIYHIGCCRFIFKFKFVRDFRRVLNGGPYQIYGHLLMLQIWTPSIAPAMVIFSTTPLWLVILNHLPIHFGVDWVKRLVFQVGEVLEMYPANGIPFGEGAVSVKIAINPFGALPQGINVRNPSYDYHWVSFYYPFLPNWYCEDCFNFGHKKPNCPRGDNQYDEFDERDNWEEDEVSSYDGLGVDFHVLQDVEVEVINVDDEENVFIQIDDVEELNIIEIVDLDESDVTDVEYVDSIETLSVNLEVFADNLEVDLLENSRSLKRARTGEFFVGPHNLLRPNNNLQVMGQVDPYSGLSLLVEDVNTVFCLGEGSGDGLEIEEAAVTPTNLHLIDTEARSPSLNSNEDEVEFINSQMSELGFEDRALDFFSPKEEMEEVLSGNLPMVVGNGEDWIDSVEFVGFDEVDLKMHYDAFAHENFDLETSELDLPLMGASDSLLVRSISASDATLVDLNLPSVSPQVVTGEPEQV